jgi:hypothetical protein
MCTLELEMLYRQTTVSDRCILDFHPKLAFVDMYVSTLVYH